MTKIAANLIGSYEEKNPLELCPVCDVLPVLNVILDRPVKIFFCCPKCGDRALIWHVDMEKMIECQKCGTWFTVTHNYGEAEPPEERKGKVKE